MIWKVDQWEISSLVWSLQLSLMIASVDHQCSITGWGTTRLLGKHGIAASVC